MCLLVQFVDLDVKIAVIVPQRLRRVCVEC
nr:MAG TPA: hypothetical protein [Caudoviricetes sp.]